MLEWKSDLFRILLSPGGGHVGTYMYICHDRRPLFWPIKEVLSMEQQTLTLHICGLSVRISFAPDTNMDVLEEVKQMLLTHYEQGRHA